MDYVIVSAATEGSRYVECLEAQRAHYPDHLFVGVILPDQGSWEENTKIKPVAIREAFDVCSVVLWVDADCLVEPPSELPPGDWDICTLYNVHPHHKLKTSAGFILLRDTANTRRFLDHWDRLNVSFKKDHPAMIRALRCNLKVADMSAWLGGRHTINAFAPERGVFAG